MQHIAHLHGNNLEADIRREVQQWRSNKIIAVIGPPGVGKTYIKRKALRSVYALPWGTGQLPVIEVFASLASAGFFNPKGHVRSAVDQLLNPNLKWLECPNATQEASGALDELRVELADAAKSIALLKPRLAISEAEYWDNFSVLSIARGLQVLCIEHCNAMLVNRRDTSPAQHIMQLMTVLETTPIMALLTGVPGAEELWTTRPELSRRVIVLWAMNYSLRDQQEILAYTRLMEELTADIKTKPRDLFARIGVGIVTGTAGTLGQIQKTLDRARLVQATAGREEMIEADIESSFLSGAEIRTIWESVRAFDEARLTASKHEISQIASEYIKLPATTIANQPGNRPSR